MASRPVIATALLGLACLTGRPAAARAQDAGTGTAVMLARITMPDSSGALTRIGLDELAMRWTYATDGRRAAMHLQFEGTQVVMGMPLEDILIHLIFDPATDSLAIGVTLPPDLMTQLGGGIGFAFGFVLPDSLALPSSFGDSILVNMTDADFSYRELGTADTVAGVPCRNYEMSGNGAVSNVCLGEPPAALAAINRMMEQMPGIGAGFKAISKRQRELLGTDDYFTLRMNSTFQGGGMTLELASATAGPPDPGFFTLATGLGPLPPEILGALMQGAAAATTGAPDAP